MRHLLKLLLLFVFILIVAGISYSADCISATDCTDTNGEHGLIYPAQGMAPLQYCSLPEPDLPPPTPDVVGIGTSCMDYCYFTLDPDCSKCYVFRPSGPMLPSPPAKQRTFCSKIVGKYCNLYDTILSDSVCLAGDVMPVCNENSYCVLPGIMHIFNVPVFGVAIVRMKNSAAGDPGICSEVCDPSFSSEAYWTGTHWSCMCTSTRNDELCWQKCKGATGVGVSRLDCYFPHPQAYAGITQQQCAIVDVPCTDAYENYCDGSSYIDYSGKTCKVQGTWNSLTNKCEVSGQLCQCEPKINTDISNPCNTVIKCGGVPNYVNGQQACYEDTAGAMGAWGNYKTKTTLILGKTVGKISLPGQCDRTCGFQYSCDALLNSKDFEASCTEQKEIKGLGCFNTPPVIELCNCVEGGGNCISNYNSDSEAGKEFPDVKLNECQRDNLL